MEIPCPHRAVADFLSHLQRLPDPQSKKEMYDLLRFRLREFCLGDDQGPATQEARERVADRASEFMNDKQRFVRDALRELLDAFELTLAHDASKNLHGLFAPDLLPKDGLVTSSDKVYLTNRRALPPDHPLHAIEGGNVLGWIPICEGRTISRIDGTTTTLLPEWATVSSVQQKVQEQAAEEQQQRRRDEERRRWVEQEAERQRRLALTAEQRMEERLEHLEKQLANQA
jgi:hypothetical protein